jgi:hypothetical protein
MVNAANVHINTGGFSFFGGQATRHFFYFAK